MGSGICPRWLREEVRGLEFENLECGEGLLWRLLRSIGGSWAGDLPSGKIDRAGTAFWASLKMLLRMSKSLRRHLRQKSSLQEPCATTGRPECTLGASRRGLHTLATLPGVGVGVGVDKEVVGGVVQMFVAES